MEDKVEKKETVDQEGSPTGEQSDPDDTVPELPDLNLSEELAKAQAKAEENYDLYVRAVAECENVRRRAAEDSLKARKFGIEKFAKALLPVVDSFEKALEASSGEAGHLKEGLEITYKQLIAALEANGLVCENPIGLKFDPNTMQAITMIADPSVQKGCVAQVFQKGWMLSDRVLRPAMVAVAQ